MNDTTNFSGDFRGAVINFKSTLTNVQQSIKNMPAAGDADKNELESLVAELSAALESLPADRGELAQALALQTESLVEEAKKEQPNKTLLGLSADGLKQAAGTVADITPKVLETATRIADFIVKLSGG